MCVHDDFYIHIHVYNACRPIHAAAGGLVHTYMYTWTQVSIVYSHTYVYRNGQTERQIVRWIDRNR